MTAGADSPRPWPLQQIAAGVLVLALGTTARLAGIAEQPPLTDEVLSAFSADNYVHRGQFGPTMPFHPNLRNLLLAASTAALGSGAWGLRGPSLLLGCATIPLLGLLVLRLTRDRRAALLAALLVAVDPVHITFSRQAIQEVHTTFFFVLGVLLFLRALDASWRLRPGPWLALAGCAFGLSVASKHHGLLPLAVCLGFALHCSYKQRDAALAAQALVSLALVPFSVYLLTYWPWFTRGYDLPDWASMQLALLSAMLRHQGTAAASALDSRPWQWFIRPLMGYGNFTHARGKPVVTVAMGNPLVWLPVLPASVVLLRKERGEIGHGLLQLLFWVAYLPLALSPRPIWLLSSLAVTPFAFALVGRLVSRLTAAHRRWLLVYGAALVVVSALMWPMAAARGWEHGYLRRLVMRFSPH